MTIRSVLSAAVIAGVSCNLAYADALEFEVVGVENKLKDNIEAYLDVIPENERKLNFRLESRVRKEASKALEALGYFSPQVTFAGTTEKGFTKKKALVVKVAAGTPTRISAVDIQISGEAKDDPAFAELLQKAPKVGDVLDQSEYDSIKSSIQQLAINRGYFDSEYTLSRLEVSPKLEQAFLRLHFTSGTRYRFGQINYHNSQIDLDRLDSLRDFKTQEFYDVSKIGDFNQSLNNTGWFGSAVVEPDLNNLNKVDVPININLEAAPRNLFETGLGYSTDSGPRVKVSWKKPWFNRKGHSLESDLYVSKPKQTISTGYKIPLADVEHEYYQLKVGVENLDERDTRSLELVSSISRHWLYETGWQRIAYLRWLYSDFSQGEIKDKSSLLIPGINFVRLRSRGGTLPSWADKQNITFEFASDSLASDIDLVRLYGEAAWIRSIKNENKHRFLTRLTSGMIFTPDLEPVPPSMRFFAGGDNTIRGYQFKSISPRDATGELTGGKFMAAASLEYNLQVANDWWLALFADSGDAWSDNLPELKTGAGFGVRWRSPVGPVRIDLAHGFQNEDDNFTVHFSLGPEL
ncbi:MAG: autotransporter assembly complex protein TamA [Enterovibrio sp.]